MTIQIGMDPTAAVADKRFGVGTLHLLNERGAVGMFLEYDPAETTLTLVQGMPVGFKNGSKVLSTADLSDSAANKCIGPALAVPTATNKYYFALVHGHISDFGITLPTDGAVDDGELLIWGADLVWDPIAAATEIACGIAHAADDTVPELSEAFIHSPYSAE